MQIFVVVQCALLRWGISGLAIFSATATIQPRITPVTAPPEAWMN
jgi:hypothetical protein